MKKLISVFASFAVAIAAVAVLSGATSPVSATTAETCVSGTKHTDFDGSYSGRDTMTVWTKGNKKLCNDVNVNFTTFKVLNTYNGKGFSNNPTALPQQSTYNKTVTLKKGTDGKTTVKVEVPAACIDYQIDAYIGPVQTKITTKEGLVDTTAIVGKLFQRTQQSCDVKVCNPANGQIITVKESEASKYKPVGDEACKDIRVCEYSTKTTKTIKGYQFDSAKYSKNLDDAKCKVPGKVNVCDATTGKIISVDEDKASQYKPVNDAACKEEDAPAAIPSTGPASALMSMLGAGSIVGSGYYYIQSRRKLNR